MQDIEKTISSIGDLPSQPVVLQKLHLLVNNKDTSSHKVAQIIETDQGFTARVLRLVNSPFFGFTRKIASVEEAITMIGFNSIHQLLLATSLMGTFQIDEALLKIKEFWRHCFAVGVVAKHIIAPAYSNLKDECFASGVLHDVGRLILINANARKYQECIEKTTGVIDLTSEKQIFGVNHQETGNLLAEHWRFPESIRAGIGYHHTPTQAPEFTEIASAVHLADIIAHGMNLGNSGSFFISNFDKDACLLLQLNIDELESILETALNEIEETEQILGEFQ
ncbi:MAG: HDOD domain-containing protein [candidate division Zixibacteria bacterium]|nr:HDOD domain-containing protein [candidate division Zixibacteria bacterium]